MTRIIVAVLAALALAGCVASDRLEAVVDAGYASTARQIREDVDRVRGVHDDLLDLSETLACGGTGAAPLRAYDDEQRVAWCRWCAAVRPEEWAGVCPAEPQMPVPRPR